MKKPNNKVALVTTLSDNYFYSFQHMLTTFKKNNSDVANQIDLVIIDVGLSDKYKNRICSIPSLNGWVYEFDQDDYSLKTKNGQVSIDQLAELNQTNIKVNYFKFEVIRLGKLYDRIVFIDSDCLVLGSIRNLFNTRLFNENMFYAVYDHHKRVPKYSMGVHIFNPEFVSNIDNLFNYLVKNIINVGGVLGCTKSGESDQAVYNELLSDKFSELDHRYNARSLDIENPIIFHFAGPYKPWKEDFQKVNISDARWTIDDISGILNIWRKTEKELQGKLLL